MALVVDSAHNLGIEPEAVQAFYRAHWKRGIALTEPDFYNWQFLRPPESGGTDHNVLCIEDTTGDILGVIGVHPRTFMLDNQPTHGAEMTTWVNAPEAHGRGIGTKVLKRAQEEFDVLTGFSVGSTAVRTFMHTGFVYSGMLPRVMKVFDENIVGQFTDYPPLGRKISRSWEKNYTPTTYKTVEADIELMDYANARMFSSFHGFTRSAEQLSWRYLNHPVFDYQLHAIEHPAEAGRPSVAIAVTRIEDNIKGLRVLHVLDLIGDVDAMPAAVSYLHDYARAQDIHFADFYCTSSTCWTHFASAGWFSLHDHSFFQFPHLFHPLELRSPPTPSFVLWVKKGTPQLGQLAPYYITKQDADLDRPTLATLQGTV